MYFTVGNLPLTLERIDRANQMGHPFTYKANNALVQSGRRFRIVRFHLRQCVGAQLKDHAWLINDYCRRTRLVQIEPNFTDNVSAAHRF